MLCVVIKGPTFEAVQQQVAEAAVNADIVELRLDCFQQLDLAALHHLRTLFSIPMIFTLRCRSQGGFYTKSEHARLVDIENLAKLKPDYLDLESCIAPPFVQHIASQHPEIKIILSHHAFSNAALPPKDIFHKMRNRPAFYYKIAVNVENSSEALKLLSWAKTSDKDLIAIGIGPYGQITRILGPIMKTPITYACLNDVLTSAPGQLSVSALSDLYRFHSLNPNTIIYGLIGNPVDRSISDVTHNALFKACGLDAVYVKMPVKESELQEFLLSAKSTPFRGLSVTMPLKECIIPYIDEIDLQAQKIGAVNTLKFHEGKIFGFNTDGMGALNAIEHHLSVERKRIIIIGAGGAAKAIAYESCRRGANVVILNRNAERAHQIARNINCEADGLSQIGTYAKSSYDIIINCTPSSMPIESTHILPGSLVMDISTRPKETEFLILAKQKGCRVVYGYEMFIEQAVGQYGHWFEGQLDLMKCRKILKKITPASLSL